MDSRCGQTNTAPSHPHNTPYLGMAVVHPVMRAVDEGGRDIQLVQAVYQRTARECPLYIHARKAQTKAGS